MQKTSEMDNAGAPPHAEQSLAVLCFSHLRWNFVYQRPQHLMSRVSQCASVYYIEEPMHADIPAAALKVEMQSQGVQVITPLLPHAVDHAEINSLQRELLDQWLREQSFASVITWYYTPMALLFSDHVRADVTVYDCMDQLSAFQGAPPELIAQERRLFEIADVVFTGGRSLYEEKHKEHRNVHLFPSSVDRAHFARARATQDDPADQASIPHPRIGFFGVLDERLDRELLRTAAQQQPDWHFVMIGPVVKIREDELPRAANIHYLGQKQYSELPHYISNWDVAMLPFAQNASTRFISPTKTPEYLAAGKPVVSTPIRDVVEPYGRLGLTSIAADAGEFCAAIYEALQPREREWLQTVDAFLQNTSWDQTFARMWREVSRRMPGADTNCSGEEVVHV
jgi:UDP-galactopyranose mutase